MIRAVAWPVKIVVALAILVDELLRPIYRPVINRIVGLPFFALLHRQVAALPRWAILIAFSVPFLIAEPLKLAALILIAKGRIISGAVTFAFAQLMTFILVERIFHAGRAKLLTYGWFAWIIDRISAIRDRVMASGRRALRLLKLFVRRHAR